MPDFTFRFLQVSPGKAGRSIELPFEGDDSLKRRSLLITALCAVVVLFTVANLALAAAPPKVGLVLGGGAARGFSHIGLIKALEEQGIPIDILVGTSMGSIVASLYAAVYSVENMEMLIASLDLSQLVQILIPPQGGIVDTTRFERYLDVLLHGQSISELGIPFYPVITELLTGEEVALGQGSAATGVRASMSIPGLFPPVEIQGKYYVDGGMKNAVPANVAEDKGADVIIAVDVKKELPEVDFNNILNNVQLTMWFMIDGYVQLNTEGADVIIVPEVKFDSYMDFQRADYFIEQGYASGLAYMEEIKRAILAEDPDFQFVPYEQEGFSDEEMLKIITAAKQAAAQVKPRFSIKPGLELESPYGIGLEVSGGPLGWLSAGYRYWLGDRGHEGYVGLTQPGVGKISLGLRTSSTWDGIGYRLQAESVPFWGSTTLKASYQTKGEDWWKVSLHNPKLLASTSLALGLDVGAGQRRLPAQESFVQVAPLVRIYPTSGFTPVAEAALVRPYFFAGVDIEHTLGADTAFDVHGGIGSEVRLFGLYPIDVQAGLKRAHTQELEFRFAVIGGRF
jgi:NTE family protein